MTNDKRNEKTPLGRRKVLGAAVGVASGLVGVAAGVALGGARSDSRTAEVGRPHDLTGAALVIDGGKTAHAG